MADDWDDWSGSAQPAQANQVVPNFSAVPESTDGHHATSTGMSTTGRRRLTDWPTDSSPKIPRTGAGRARLKSDWNDSGNNNSWGRDDYQSSRNDSLGGWSGSDRRSARDSRSEHYGVTRSAPRDEGSWGGSSRGFGSDSKKMKISSRDVGRVIGRGGATIKDLEAKSGARIKLNKETAQYDETEVELIGSAEQKDRAEELISQLLGIPFQRSTSQSQSQSSSYSSKSKDSWDQLNNWGNSSSSNNYQSKQSSNQQSESDDYFIDWGAAIKESEEATKKKWASLPPVVRHFYHEDPEVAGMTKQQVKELRLDSNNIMVRHFKEDDTRPIPNPVTNFKQAFSQFPEILEEINKNGFEKPSPIQSQSWPILLQGMDLIGIAQTGTGKTLAYLLPAMIHIDNQKLPRSERPGPTALILAPTRELAQQIEREAAKYSYKAIKSICIYGGGDRQSQIGRVGQGIEIVIATPGRLNDLCMNRHIDLTAVSYLVLDEADRMLDMGFEPQIKKILIDVRPDRQTVMMSATWPLGVERMANNYMKDPMKIDVGTLDLAAVETVTQKIVMTDAESKRKIMYDFIKNMQGNEKVIIFVGKKALVDDLSSDCALRGISCQSMHGDRDQSDREQAIDDLKTGYSKVLIATDVASRGLDIEDITHIFNFDFPRNIEEYVHRVGRTGRAGKTGEAITLFTREDWRHAQELIDILSKNNQVVPVDLLAMAARYDAWKKKHDAEIAACGGRFRGGGGGGGERRGRW